MRRRRCPFRQLGGRIEPATQYGISVTNNIERRPLRRSIRSLLVAGIGISALMATVSLPAHAGEHTASVVNVGTRTEALATSPTSQSGYPTTSLDSIREAEAAARLGWPAATEPLPSQVTAYPGNYMHDASAAWVRPVPGRVTSPYGPRGVICNSSGCSNSFHDGIDLGSSCGTPVKAISPGRVTFVANAGAFGNRVILDHGSGVESLYGHLQDGSFKVSVGQLVQAGTVVASVGATGVATGCHLDLKIRVGGAFIDPAPWMQFRGVTL